MRVILVLVTVGIAAAKPPASEQYDATLASLRADLTCGTHTLTAGSYTISSPDYPSNYGNSYDCTYSLTPGAGVGLCLVECSGFYIEDHSSCSYDWLKVGDAKFCGTEGPSTTMFGPGDIEFHTDDSVVRPGFQCTITARPASVITELACGTHAVTPGLYSIKSPNYPAEYDNGFDCAYSITPGAGVTTMTLACYDFSIEANPSCDWDWLEVNGVKYCGRQGPALSGNGAFSIAFHSDDTVVESGYYCEVRATA